MFALWLNLNGLSMKSAPFNNSLDVAGIGGILPETPTVLLYHFHSEVLYQFNESGWFLPDHFFDRSRQRNVIPLSAVVWLTSVFVLSCANRLHDVKAIYSFILSLVNHISQDIIKPNENPSSCKYFIKIKGPPLQMSYCITYFIVIISPFCQQHDKV